MDALVTAVTAAGGLVVGDQLEIVVERLGAHADLRRPWWACPSCQAPAGAAALVPVVRVVARHRGCRSCGTPVAHPLRPAILALVSAVVMGGFAARLGADPVLPAFVVLAAALVAVSAVDLERLIIPNRILYPAAGAITALLLVGAVADDRWGSMARAAIAAVAAFAAFFVVHAVAPRGMGFGDVRLAGVVGLATGWLGLGHAFVAFLAAFVLGSVVGTVVMVVSGQGRRTRVPFGPFLAAGAVVAVVVGNPIVRVLFHRGA